MLKITADGKVSESAKDSSMAQYVRFEIIPEDDSDGKISLFEKGGYAKQVTITVNKWAQNTIQALAGEIVKSVVLCGYGF